MPGPIVVTGDTEVTKIDVVSCLGEVGMSWDWREGIEF